MDSSCDVVRDLLPLYVDGLCSDASRALVEEHVRVCPACAKTLSRLRDSACEDSLRRETANVLAPRRWRNRAFAVSCALAAFLCLPACLIAVLGRGPGSDYPLSWLMLLAPSLLVVLAATLLPLRCRRYTGRWTLLGYTASLLLLLMACALYTSGGTALRTGETWFFVASAAALYVLSAGVILPWVLRELPLKGRFAGKKAAALALWDGAFALLLCECLALAAPDRHPAVLGIGAAALLALTALAVVVLMKGLRMDKLASLGVCVAVAGNALCWLVQPMLRLTGAEGDVTRTMRTAGTAALLIATAAGLVLVGLGAWRAYGRMKKSKG